MVFSPRYLSPSEKQERQAGWREAAANVAGVVRVCIKNLPSRCANRQVAVRWAEEAFGAKGQAKDEWVSNPAHPRFPGAPLMMYVTLPAAIVRDKAVRENSSGEARVGDERALWAVDSLDRSAPFMGSGTWEAEAENFLAVARLGTPEEKTKLEDRRRRAILKNVRTLCGRYGLAVMTVMPIGRTGCSGVITALGGGEGVGGGGKADRKVQGGADGNGLGRRGRHGGTTGTNTKMLWHGRGKHGPVDGNPQAGGGKPAWSTGSRGRQGSHNRGKAVHLHADDGTRGRDGGRDPGHVLSHAHHPRRAALLADEMAAATQMRGTVGDGAGSS